MTNTDTDFETWLSCLQMNLLDDHIYFYDKDSVRVDYDAGKNMFDVKDEIVAEYG